MLQIELIDDMFLIIATLGAGFACLFLSGSTHAIYIFIGGFLFGGFALPLYSLSAAQAYDNAEPSQFVELAASFDIVLHTRCYPWSIYCIIHYG